MKIKRLILTFLLIVVYTSSVNAQIIEDGVYQIYSETHDATLESPADVNQDDTAPDEQINNLFATTSDASNDYQLFEFFHQGADVYKIKNLGTDQFVGKKIIGVVTPVR